MPARVGNLAYFRAGQPFRFLAKGPTGGLKHFRKGQPFRGLMADQTGVITYTVTPSGGVQMSGQAVESVMAGGGGWRLVGGGPTRSPLVKEGGPAMGHLGDFGVGQKVVAGFQTTSAAGVPTAISSGAATVYKDGTTSKSATGATLTASLDAVTGFNQVVVDTAQDLAFYTPGADFQIVLTAGTVGGVSVVGSVVASFSLRNRPEPVLSTATVTSDIKSAGG